MVAAVLVVLAAPAGAQPAPQPAPRAPSTGYSWPLSPVPVVLRPFQPPMHPYGPGHRGVDLAGAVGQPVLAAADGVVVFAGPLAGRGVVSVQHPDGLRTTYEPVTAAVAAGAAVRARCWASSRRVIRPAGQRPACTGVCGAEPSTSTHCAW